MTKAAQMGDNLPTDVVSALEMMRFGCPLDKPLGDQDVAYFERRMLKAADILESALSVRSEALEEAYQACYKVYSEHGGEGGNAVRCLDAIRALSPAREAFPDRAPEPSGEFVRVRKDVVEFLRGAAPLDGFWFGEKPLALAAFWWRKYLSAAEASQGVVDYVRVPREPTKIMLEAGDMALHDPDDLADAYRAMLAVAALNPRAAWPFPDPKPVAAAEASKGDK